MESPGTSSAATQSTHTTALRHLRNCLKCAICSEKPPRDVHICPRCSEMFCYSCAARAMSGRACPGCNGTVRIDQLIKLRCFDMDADQLAVQLASLHVDGPSTSEQPEQTLPPVVATADQSEAVDLMVPRSGEVSRVAVGRQEPVEGLPPAVQGTFTLRNVRGCRLAWVYSEHVVDEMGFKWRLKINAGNRPRSNKIGVYVELLFGEEGFYEILLERKNLQPGAFLNRGNIKCDEAFGMDNFVDKESLPLGKIDLQIRYTIRPADFQAKVQILQRLLAKRKTRTRELAGPYETFQYYIDDFSRLEPYDMLCEEYDDKIDSRWRIGVHETSKFAEFHLTLVGGIPGIYSLTAELTHPIAGREKRLSYERNILLNQRNFFNFRIEWNQLQEYGYDHGDDDQLLVEFTIRALQLNLKSVQDAMSGSDDSESDDEYYSSSSSY